MLQHLVQLGDAGAFIEESAVERVPGCRRDGYLDHRRRADSVRRHEAGNRAAEAGPGRRGGCAGDVVRSEEHTSELQSLLRISYAVFCLTQNTTKTLTKSIAKQ